MPISSSILRNRQKRIEGKKESLLEGLSNDSSENPKITSKRDAEVTFCDCDSDFIRLALFFSPFPTHK